jgi:LysR family glycine cleavage system transcriptional activator
MARKLPPLLALRVFECASRHLSFTRAADELCVTQAAVSHQIRALEDWFGKPLFLRLNRTLKLTEAGEMLQGPLTAALDMIAEATSQVSNDDGRKTLKVVALDSFVGACIIPVLPNFHQRFPDIDLRFLSKPVEEDALATGDAEIEIRYGNGQWPGMHAFEFLKEDIFPVCSPKLLEGREPLTDLAQLSEFELIHDVMSIDWLEFLDHFEVLGVNARGGFGFNHSNLVLRAALAGHGFALGREALVASAIKSGDLVRPFEESITSSQSYYIVCRPQVSDTPEVKAFSYWLLDELEAMDLQTISDAS